MKVVWIGHILRKEGNLVDMVAFDRDARGSRRRERSKTYGIGEITKKERTWCEVDKLASSRYRMILTRKYRRFV